MKNQNKRILSLLLAAMLALPALASCGSGSSGDEAPAKESTAAADTAEAVETEDPNARQNAKDNLPADLNYKGAKVTILAQGAATGHLQDLNGFSDDDSDVLNDAIHQRNMKVEERLNVKLAPDFLTDAWKDYRDMMKSLVASGDTSHDFFYTMGNASIQSDNDVLFLDLADAPYLDYEQPWWWINAMTELSLDGKTFYYLVSEACISNYSCAGAAFFNKKLYTDYLGDPDDMYRTVLDGKWTLDKWGELSQKCYNDLNGNGIQDKGDLWGSYFGNVETLKEIEYATDLTRFTRDKDGYIQFGYDIERAAQLVEKLNKLLYETKGLTYVSDLSAGDSYTIFANGEEVFLIRQLSAAASATLREMEDDYGVIPQPKMDEKQKEYRSLIHNNSNFIVIPKTAASNLERTCAVIEALSAESYRTVTDVYYEIAMKMKYSRDAYSGQCMDLIRETAVKSVLFEYNVPFKYGGTIVTTCVGANSNDFASKYASVKSAAEAAITARMEQLAKEKAAG